MATVAVYTMDGAESGQIELSDALFGAKVNIPVMHQVVVAHLANQRRGTQSALTRGEVSGGGRKPWRQKGTGHARQGSNRAPQWVGGGVVFAPKPRDYSQKVNKKVRRAALCSALSSKVQENKLLVLETLELNEIKTRAMKKVLDTFSVTNALIVSAGENRNVVLSARNLPGIKTTRADMLNTYDILKYDRLIVTRDAVQKMEEVYNG